MKWLLILVALLALGYYFFIYRKSPAEPQLAPATETPSAASAVTPLPSSNEASLSHSFDGVSALLRTDMNAIPMSIDGPRRPPANAIAIKHKVRPYLNLHPEYQVLTQACDLIIQADQERTTLQSSCHAEQSRVSFNNALEHDTSRHSAYTAGHVPGGITPPPTDTAGSIHQRIEGSWSTYRAESARQVQGLLGSLAGKHL